MGDWTLTVLRHLRVYGPCSVRDLASKIPLHGHPLETLPAKLRAAYNRQAVYRAVYELRRVGLAERLAEESYDVTEKGRLFLAEWVPAGVRRKQPVLFEGC